MSRHSLNISLSDLIELPARLSYMQKQGDVAEQQAQTLKQKREADAQTNAELQHQRDLAHSAETVLVGHQYGIGSPEFQEELKKNKHAGDHGVAAYKELPANNPWGLPEKTWLAMDAKGAPLYEDQYSYDPDTHTTTMNEGTKGKDPRTGQTSSLAFDPDRKPLTMTPDMRQQLIRFHQTGGKPELTGTGPTDADTGAPQTQITPNVPGVAPVAAPQEAATRAQAALYRGWAMNSRASAAEQKVALASQDFKDFASTVLKAHVDPLTGKPTPEATQILDAGAHILPLLGKDPNFINVPQGARGIYLYGKALDEYGRTKPKAQDPAAAMKAALTGADQPPAAEGAPAAPAKPAGPPPPKPTGNPVVDVKARLSYANQQKQGQKLSAADAKRKSNSDRMTGYFMDEYQKRLDSDPSGNDTIHQQSALSIARQKMQAQAGYGIPGDELDAAEQDVRKAIATPPQPAPTPAAPAQPPRGDDMAAPAPQQQPPAAVNSAKGGVAKVGKVMHEWKAGQLHSGSKAGPVVTDQRRAIAIALKQAGMSRAANGGAAVGAPRATSAPIRSARGGVVSGFGIRTGGV